MIGQLMDVVAALKSITNISSISKISYRTLKYFHLTVFGETSYYVVT